MDSVLEVFCSQDVILFGSCFNPSFCGFGIGGLIVRNSIFYNAFVSILVSVDSVLEG